MPIRHDLVMTEISTYENDGGTEVLPAENTVKPEESVEMSTEHTENLSANSTIAITKCHIICFSSPHMSMFY